MIELSVVKLSEILHAKVVGENQEINIIGVSTDTRTLQPGNLYIAIKGEHYDGHDFIKEAIAKGASAALVGQAVEAPLPQIIVDDTIAALGKLSAFWRDKHPIPLIAVTGSNGKTTLKNMIAAILKAACNNDEGAVLATAGNFNNNIGLPLTLLRLNAKHRYGVIEMGMNHFGEIAYLTQLTKPQVCVITNAAEAHLEGVHTIGGVAKAKAEIFTGLVHNGTAILNCDDGFFSYWSELTKNFKSLSFGLKNSADIMATQIKKQVITIQTPNGATEVNLPLIGTHNIMNALAATAATLALNIKLDYIKEGLENVVPAKGRMHQYLLPNGCRIIDDTYNANPFSLKAAINTLASLTGKKILVLGDMKELGPNEKQIHTQAGKDIRAANIDYLFTYGHLTSFTANAFGDNAQHFEDHDTLITALQPYLKNKVNLLVKGSRSMKMEHIIRAIIPKDQLEHAH